MGAGAATGVSAAVAASSGREIAGVLATLSDEQRLKLRAAVSGPTALRSLAPEKLESASDILQAIRDKKVSCLEVVEKSLARISATEEHLKACPEVLADDAVTRARAVDERIAKGEALRPLEGLPIVVKINVDVAGTLSTASNPVLDGWRPSSTAPVVQALLDNGAIVVAKTNMPLMARVPESLSPLHGKCRNPLNLSHSPAGSSSGTAAAIAAGAVACGIGSDTGGSCRIPAVCCGIVGFRPSPGRYSISGIVPCIGPADTAGPLGCSVRDIMLLDTAITGAQHETNAGPSLVESLKGMKVATPEDWIVSDQFANKTNKISWDAVTATLSGKGVELLKDELGKELLWKHAFVNITKNSWKDLDEYLEAHRKGGAQHAGIAMTTKEFVEKTGCGEERYFRVPNEDAEKAAEEERGLQAATKAAEDAIAEYFAKTGAKFLLTPGMSGLPLNIEKAELDANCKVLGRAKVSETVPEALEDMEAFKIVLAFASKFAGLLTSIAIPTPIRCQATGLPTGLILWGPRDSDQDLLRAAAAVEAALSAIDASQYAVSF